ncbi:MAG TPA: hypothetical protein VFE22_03370 [Edaphobacter sp.]|jgi:hypothetical protein|nr:hypothetical protein [Edaphobacter sp.]
MRIKYFRNRPRRSHILSKSTDEPSLGIEVSPATTVTRLWVWTKPSMFSNLEANAAIGDDTAWDNLNYPPRALLFCESISTAIRYQF